MNSALEMWDRAWIRRAGYALAAVVLAVGLIAFLNARSHPSASHVPVVPGSPGYLEQAYGKQIPLPKQAVGIGRTFIHDAVLRQDLAGGWTLSTAHLHGGLTRAQWMTGRIPVQPFEADAYDGTTYKVVHSRARSLLLLLLLQSHKRGVQAGEFFMELVPAGGTWKVNYWGPRGTNPPVPAERT